MKASITLILLVLVILGVSLGVRHARADDLPYRTPEQVPPRYFGPPNKDPLGPFNLCLHRVGTEEGNRICRGPDGPKLAAEEAKLNQERNARLDALPQQSAYEECLFRGHAFLSPGTMIYGGANQTMMNIEAYCAMYK